MWHRLVSGDAERCVVKDIECRQWAGPEGSSWRFYARTLSVWWNSRFERRTAGSQLVPLRHVPALVRGPMFAVHGGTGVTFKGLTPVAYRSSEWAERGFCPTCGTHLFYHLLPTGEYILPAGLFQEQSFELTCQIFIDEKPGFYALKNDTPTLTGQEVFEQFAPKA